MYTCIHIATKTRECHVMHTYTWLPRYIEPWLLRQSPHLQPCHEQKLGHICLRGGSCCLLPSCFAHIHGWSEWCLFHPPSPLSASAPPTVTEALLAWCLVFGGHSVLLVAQFGPLHVSLGSLKLFAEVPFAARNAANIRWGGDGGRGLVNGGCNILVQVSYSVEVFHLGSLFLLRPLFVISLRGSNKPQYTETHRKNVLCFLAIFTHFTCYNVEETENDKPRGTAVTVGGQHGLW